MMKKSPQQERLEHRLKASKFSGTGFLGSDSRSVEEIIEADAIELQKAGKTCEDVGNRMQEITNLARKGLGDWVQIDDTLKARVDDSRGVIPCPWAHGVRCLKNITTVQRIDTGMTMQWSELNTHLIKAHGFFEGKGAQFRLEPRELIAMIF
jgi:hypothetical protein